MKGFSVARKEDIRSQMILLVNALIVQDFDGLIQLLYRIDVSEKKLRLLLQEKSSTDAAELITDLIIERLQQKEQSRFTYKPNNDIPEDEKW